MEDVLEVYERKPDPLRPLICLDEFAKQLLSETRQAQPATVNHVRRYDSEYVREGSVTGFMIAQPHAGIRDVFFAESNRRTSKDFAYCLDYLSKSLPEAQKIVLVMDNLNTHKEASLYEAFGAEKARALCERFEMHYTPKHGSWLNMAEIEIGSLVRSCLDQRIESAEKIRTEVAAYIFRKNQNPVPMKWQFTNEDARIKLHSIYPEF